MPLYQQIIVAFPGLQPNVLVDLCKKLTGIIIKNKGVVRGIENHGIRPLPERARRRYATTDGNRYFWEARFITATFDASPDALVEAERMLKSNDSVLRTFVVKQKMAFDRSRATNYKNPYLK